MGTALKTANSGRVASGTYNVTRIWRSYDQGVEKLWITDDKNLVYRLHPSLRGWVETTLKFVERGSITLPCLIEFGDVYGRFYAEFEIF